MSEHIHIDNLPKLTFHETVDLIVKIADNKHPHDITKIIRKDGKELEYNRNALISFVLGYFIDKINTETRNKEQNKNPLEMLMEILDSGAKPQVFRGSLEDLIEHIGKDNNCDTDKCKNCTEKEKCIVKNIFEHAETGGDPNLN